MTEKGNDAPVGAAFVLREGFKSDALGIATEITTQWPRHRRRTMSEQELHKALEMAASWGMVTAVNVVRQQMADQSVR
jgi:hypothetical protein